MRDAEQDADVTLGHSLRAEALCRVAGEIDGIDAKPFCLSAGLSRLADLVRQRRVEYGHEFYVAGLGRVDVEVQRQQVAYGCLSLIEVPGLGVRRVWQVVAGYLESPPALTAARSQRPPAVRRRAWLLVRRARVRRCSGRS
jgi:hypothetical protein